MADQEKGDNQEHQVQAELQVTQEKEAGMDKKGHQVCRVNLAQGEKMDQMDFQVKMDYLDNLVKLVEMVSLGVMALRGREDLMEDLEKGDFLDKMACQEQMVYQENKEVQVYQVLMVLLAYQVMTEQQVYQVLQEKEDSLVQMVDLVEMV